MKLNLFKKREKQVIFHMYNITGTAVEQVKLFNIAMLNLYITLGLKGYILQYNQRVRDLLKWRKEFFAEMGDKDGGQLRSS